MPCTKLPMWHPSCYPRYSLEEADYTAAERHLSRALSLCERFDYSDKLQWRLLYNYGLTLAHMDKLPAAKRSLEAAGKLSPCNHTIAAALTAVCLLDGQLHDA